jgi:hypothetical protein
MCRTSGDAGGLIGDTVGLREALCDSVVRLRGAGDEQEHEQGASRQRVNGRMAVCLGSQRGLYEGERIFLEDAWSHFAPFSVP